MTKISLFRNVVGTPFIYMITTMNIFKHDILALCFRFNAMIYS